MRSFKGVELMSKISIIWESGNHIELSLVHDYELYQNGLCRVYTSYGILQLGCEEYPVKEVRFIE